MATGHSIAQHSLRGGEGQGLPRQQKRPEQGPCSHGLLLLPEAPQASVKKVLAWGRAYRCTTLSLCRLAQQGISIQMWRRGRLGAAGSKAAHAGEDMQEASGQDVREMHVRTGRGGHVRPRTWEGLGLARSQDKRPLEGQGIITGP